MILFLRISISSSILRAVWQETLALEKDQGNEYVEKTAYCRPYSPMRLCIDMGAG